MSDDDECLTWDIPTAGRVLYGLSKNGSTRRPNAGTFRSCKLVV